MQAAALDIGWQVLDGAGKKVDLERRIGLRALDKLRSANDDQEIGIEIVRRAL